MVVLEQADYERIVGEVVDGYFNGVPLNDGVYKVACDLGLNPNQIRQVVWQANTKTHLSLFEKRAEDKMVEFPVADADYIMRRMYTPAEAQPLPVPAAEKVASDLFSPLDEGEKTAADETMPFVVESTVSPKTAAARREKALRTLEKAASELEMSIAMEREMYVEGVYKLAFELRKGVDRDEFEKDAFALYGEQIVPVLNDLRSVYKYEPVTAEKVACAFERLVDNNTKEFRALADVKGHFDNAVKFAQSLNWLNKKLQE